MGKMRAHKYKSAWGSYVQFLLDCREWAHADLADKVGIAQAQVSQYISGRSKPPLGDLTHWATVLRCTEEERERLCWLALKPWTPTPVWSKIRELEEILRNAEGALAALRRQVLELKRQSSNGPGHPAGADQ